MDPELRLPLSVVRKVMDTKLDEMGAGSKVVQTAGARAVTAAATVFLNYISGIAAEVAKEKKRVGINERDVVEALRDTDFHDIADQIGMEAVPPGGSKARGSQRSKEMRSDTMDRTATNAAIDYDDTREESETPAEEKMVVEEYPESAEPLPMASPACTQTAEGAGRQRKANKDSSRCEGGGRLDITPAPPRREREMRMHIESQTSFTHRHADSLSTQDPHHTQRADDVDMIEPID